MALNYAALANELATDPKGIGYAGTTDPAAADLLNTVRATETLERTTVPAYEVFDAIVPSEWTSLSAAEKQRVQTMLAMGTVWAQGANTRSAFAAMFAANTTTRANLVALQTRQASRAEVLFGAGVVVTHTDVAAARGRT